MMHILSDSFLFPYCLLLPGFKDTPLGTGWDLLEPESSLVAGAEPAGNCDGIPVFPVCTCVEIPVFALWPAGRSLCKQIDSTISTFGVGPGKFKNIFFNCIQI